MKRALLCCTVLVVGCVKRVPTIPTGNTITLGGKSVAYREWARVEGLCSVDGAQFVNEQTALSMVLAEWLGHTSAPADGAWDDEHLAMLDEGLKVLPPALTAQRDALEAAKTCKFGPLGSVTELNAQSLRRVDEGPWLSEQVKARLALARWKDAKPGAQKTAKDTHCPAKPKPAAAPVLYFAAEDEHAMLEWSFCDGSKVVASPGNPPAWQVDPTAKKPKKDPDPKTWLDVAAKYPGESVSRAPKLPKKKVARSDDAPEPLDAP